MNAIWNRRRSPRLSIVHPLEHVPAHPSWLGDLRVLIAFVLGLALVLPWHAAAMGTGSPVPGSCEVYPIALPFAMIDNAEPGHLIDETLAGTAPGQFGWLSWSGSPSEILLARSLEPPGDSDTYVNPEESQDHLLSRGDWVPGKPGVSNSRAVRDALDRLLAAEAIFPVWDEVRGEGAHVEYRVAAFARVQLLDYRLGGQSRIRARFLGLASCGEVNRAPLVDAGPDQTVAWDETCRLAGAVEDDGLPVGGKITVAWSQVEGPGTTIFEPVDDVMTTVEFGLPGVYLLRLEASDSESMGADEITVLVGQPNQPPAAIPAFHEINEDELLELVLRGTDPEGDPLQFTISQPPVRGTLTGDPPTLTYTPLPDYAGEDTFTFTVTDGELASAEATVAITILPVNDAPIADAQTVTGLEDEPVAITLTGADLEGSPLTFTMVEWPLHGTCSGNPPDLAYSPPPDYHGGDQFKFQVNDGELNSDPAIVRVDIQSVNDPPVVSAGLDQTFFLDESGVLLAEVSDDGTPEGGALELHWSVLNGPGVGYFENPGSTGGRVWFDAPGTYVVVLAASDGEMSSSDELVITVVPRNQPPVVQAGADQLIAFGTSASLVGTVSDDGLPAGAMLFSHWEKAGGPGTVVISRPDAQATEAHFGAPGRYQLRWIVSDSELIASDEIEITVNQMPEVNAGEDLVAVAGEPIRFRGVVTDDGLPSGETRVGWNRLDGPAPVFLDHADAVETEAVFLTAGEYHFRLTATDGHLSAADDLRVTVRPPGENLPPIVDAGPDRYIALTNRIDLEGWVSDDGLPGNTPLHIAWTLLAGPGEVEFGVASLTNTSARFGMPGIYLLELVATDGEFTTADTVACSVYPDNQPPVVDAGPDQTIVSGPLWLAGTAADDSLPAGAVLALRWDKAGGPGDVQWLNADCAAARVSFSEPGEYLLRLTADDSEFAVADTVSITVTGNQAPWVDAGPDQVLDLFVPGAPLPSTTWYPPLPDQWEYAIGQPGLGGGHVRPNSLAASGADVYIGGTFSTAGGIDVRSLTRWNGCSYSALYDPRPINPNDPNSDPVGFIAHHGLIEPVGAVGDQVFVAGGFLRDLDQNGFLDFTARWSGSGWESWEFTLACSYVAARVFLATPDAIYFGGQFKFQTSNVPAAPISFNLAKWNGQDWERLGDGIRDIRDTLDRNSIQYGIVNATALAPNGDLYAGGQFVTQTPSGLATNLARWNGAEWSPVGPGTPTGGHGTSGATILALVFTPDGNLYIGGNFTGAGGHDVGYIARWDGESWWPVGDGFNAIVHALAWDGDGLYAGGDFTRSGSVLVNHIARWDGTAWHPLENGVSDQVLALASTPSGVYAGGGFWFANAQPSNLIAKWGRKERVRVAGPDPVTVPVTATDGALVPLTIEVRHPCGEPVTVRWSVDGVESDQVDQLESGITVDATPVLFERLYAPGAHTVVAIVAEDLDEPVLFSTVVTVLAPATTSLAGSVRDDGLPQDNELVTRWTPTLAPAPVILSDCSLPTTTISFTQPGSYALRLDAHDSEFDAHDDVQIAVRPFGELNLPPTAHAGRDRTLLLSETATLTAIALDDLLPGPELQLDWFQIDGPLPLEFDPVPAADPTSNPSVRSLARSITIQGVAPGFYRFRCVASDGQFTSADDVDVRVLDLLNHAPIVDAGPNQTIELGEEARLFASAQDDGWPTGTLLTGWTVIGGPGQVSLRRDGDAWLARFDLPGDYVFRCTANDGTLDSHAEVRVEVLEHSAGPMAELHAPADGESVTTLRDVFGLVDGELLAHWRLEARPAPLTIEGGGAADWFTVSEGETSVRGWLGRLDPTVLPNGWYDLQLQATDRLGRSSTAGPVAISVEGRFKPGLFTLTFTDLSIPLAGFPIEITRTYDSRRARVGEAGDFGVGWDLALKSVNLRKSRHPGRNWRQLTSGGWYQLDPTRTREISMIFPDDRVERFQVRLVPEVQFGYPIATARLEFAPLPGTFGRLEIDGSNLASVDGFLGPVNLIDLGTFADFNPTRFRYFTPDGDCCVIDEMDGLESVTDRYGNSLRIDSTGIHHSSGVSVWFHRDQDGLIREVVDPAGNTVRYDRDAFGNLARITDRAGQVTSLDYEDPAWPHHLSRVVDPRGVAAIRTEYDESGRMIRQTDAQDRSFEFERDVAGRYELIRDRTGQQTLVEYDDRGNVVRRTDALGGATEFVYDDYDQLVRRVDALGHATTFAYDEQGNLIAETDPLGRIARYAYDPIRRLTSATDPRGHAIHYAYHDSHIQIADPSGATTSVGLTPAGLIASLTNALGHITRYDYDPLGRLIRETGPDQRVVEFRHDELGRLLEAATVEENNVRHAVQLHCDAGDRVIRAVAPDGAVAEQSFDAAGMLVRQVDPLGRATVHDRDLNGRTIRITSPDLSTVQLAYDADGRVVAITNALGNITRIVRDPLGRPIAVVHPDGTSEAAQYDQAGNLVAVTDAHGATTGFGYDPAGQVVSVTNALGEVTRFEYDANGNRTAVCNAAGHQTNFEFDPLNRLAVVRHPDGSTRHYAYDALGRLTSATDQAGRITRFEYNSQGLLTSVTNPAGHVTRFDYDALGRRTRQTDAMGRVTSFDYDACGRLTSRTLPAGQSEFFACDAAANLISHTDFNGRTTAYGYDALDRLLEKIPDPAFAAGAITYAYDAGGRRTVMTDASGVTFFHYDARNRLVTKSWQPRDLQQAVTLEYDYDPAGNLVRLRSAHLDGVDTRYEYDAIHRLSRVIDATSPDAPLATAYHYDPAGNLAVVRHPNGLITEYQHDALGRLTHGATTHPGIGLIAEFGYDLAPTGHRLTEHSRLATASGLFETRHDYTYDALDQLIRETAYANGGSSGVAYAHDLAGNRLSRSVSGSGFGALESSVHAYDLNDRLLTDLHDANGNTLQSVLPGPFDLPVTDTYDFENRLARRRAWIDGRTWAVDQIHDGDGHRVTQSVDGLTTYHLIDDLNPTGHSQVVEELLRVGDTLTPVRVHTFGHTILQQEQLVVGADDTLAWELRFHGVDGRGNVRYLANSAGDITDTWDYDGFGNVIRRAGPSDSAYLFAGERWDPELQLYDLRARLYQPDTGRFRTRDRFWGVGHDPLTLHPYLYAVNDPVNRRDPDGRFSALSMSLGVTYGLSLRTMYNGVSLQIGYGLMQSLESLDAGRSDDQIVLDYFLASTRDVALGFGTAYAARALWPALVRVASQPLASLAQSYSRAAPALQSWRNGTILSARELVRETLGTPRIPRHATQLEFRFVKELRQRHPSAWPPRWGFADSGTAFLVPGGRLDRFGEDTGMFLAPVGTPFHQRSLPSGSQNSTYSIFEVLRPFEVEAGTAAPWFSQPGGGIQYRTPKAITQLIEEGYLLPLDRR